MKLSGSPSKYGLISVNNVRAITIITNPTMSLNVKYGWNGILSMLELIPNGLFDPVWCRNNR
jgi:hypothetical protein